mgnify:CR=1 FL=1
MSENALLTEFALELRVSIGRPLSLGTSSFGARRTIPITGGEFEGPRIKGTVLPGGADYQITRPDGVTTVEAIYTIQAEDGALIHVRNAGIISAPYVRTAPVFDAPQGPHDWLNKSIFVGSLRVNDQRNGVIVRAYRVV